MEGGMEGGREGGTDGRTDGWMHACVYACMHGFSLQTKSYWNNKVDKRHIFFSSNELNFKLLILLI